MRLGIQAKKLLFIVQIVSIFTFSGHQAWAGQNSEPGAGERKEIMNELRRGVRAFEKYRMHFDYRFLEFLPPVDIEPRFRAHYLKAKDNWAWVEATAENFDVLSLCALLQKKEGKWRLEGMVNPQRVVCPSIEECIDIKAYIYRNFSNAFPSLASGLLPQVDPERKMILTALSHTITDDLASDTAYVVKYLKKIGRWVWLETEPRSLDGVNQLEPIHALLISENGRWVIKNLRPSGAECEDDPECADDQKYYRKLRNKFSSVPHDLFPQ